MDKKTCEDKVRELAEKKKVIYTLKQKRANKLVGINNKRELIFENRESKPTIDDVWKVYELLKDEEVLTKSNTPKEYFDRRIARIIYAILVEVAPDEIESKKEGQLSGIRLTRKIR